jgi:RNA-directed DNA polymerase
MSFWNFVSKLFGGKESPRERARPLPPQAPIPPAAPPSSSPTPTSTPAVVAPTSSSISTENPPSPFLPISRADLLKEGEQVRRTVGWMWFGRRDMIPPISDPRTLLIDRGMLTQGLLSENELAEMHRVGDEWTKYADRFAHIQIQAHQSGEQAVEADRAARAEIKAQKKAEALAKKKLHAEGVAHRKATDIIFVGKGVSARLKDRASDEARLIGLGLPILHTPSDLAKALDLTIPRLRWLCFHTEVATRIHYVQFETPKKSGGVRLLSAPHRILATAQQWIFEQILSRLAVHDAAHGFVPGRSTVTNAQLHCGKDLVVNIDLEGFFPSIGFRRVRHLFQRLGYSGSVATLLALLCTECPRKRVVYAGIPYFVATGERGLPQGACTSPAISNQIARALDRRLEGLTKKLQFTYSRYADDLTFSAGPGHRDKIGYLMARIRHVTQEEGFKVNPRKTRVQRPESRQVVTGLVTNVSPAVPKDLVRRIRAILHRAKSEGLAAQNRDHHPHFRSWVEGMIAYIAMVKPDVGAKLRTTFDQIADQ